MDVYYVANFKDKNLKADAWTSCQDNQCHYLSGHWGQILKYFLQINPEESAEKSGLVLFFLKHKRIRRKKKEITY